MGIITAVQVVVIYFSFYSQMFFNKSADIATCLIIFWNSNTLSMCLFQITLFMLVIKHRFKILNDVIEQDSTGRVQDLKLISEIHQNITQAIEIMNRSYCILAAFFLGSAFCVLNFILFSMKFLITYFSWDFLMVFSGKVLFNIYSFAFTIFIVVVANLASTEAKRTTLILFQKLHSKTNDSEWNFQMLSFVEQISSSQTTLSSGLFNYDWKLLFKVKLSCPIRNCNYQH